MGCVWLGVAPRLLVERRDREVRREVGALRDLLHQVDVAEKQRRLGQNGAGIREVAHRLPDPAHELVAALDPLVRVGVRAQRDVLALPRRPPELDAQELRHVDLDDDLPLEVLAGVEIQVGMGGASEAVCAGMRASSIGVDRPPERHPRTLRHLIQRRACLHLVEADSERLGRIERPHYGGLAEAGQPRLGLLLSDLEIFPTHEQMFAHRPDEPAPADRPRTIERHDAGGVDKA